MNIESVNYWDPDELKVVESKQFYIRTEGIVIEEEHGLGRSPIYLDTETGLVVHDIAAYERWLKSLTKE